MHLKSVFFQDPDGPEKYDKFVFHLKVDFKHKSFLDSGFTIFSFMIVFSNQDPVLGLKFDPILKLDL